MFPDIQRGDSSDNKLAVEAECSSSSVIPIRVLIGGARPLSSGMMQTVPDVQITNLEEILEQTGEMGHLLVLLNERAGAERVRTAMADEVLDEVIFPALADLAAFLREAIRPDMDTPEIKHLIACWIDKERESA